jgi:hypothetical protein
VPEYVAKNWQDADNHARRHCKRKSTFHLQIQINKTRAVHSPGIDALGFNSAGVRQWPAQLVGGELVVTTK